MKFLKPVLRVCFIALCFAPLASCAYHTDLFPQEVSKEIYYDTSDLDIYVDLVGCTIDSKSECSGSVGIVVNVFDAGIASLTLDTVSIKIGDGPLHVLIDMPHQVGLEVKANGNDRRGYLNFSVMLPSSSKGKHALVKVRGFLTRTDVEDERVGIDVEFLIKEDSGHAWPR